MGSATTERIEAGCAQGRGVVQERSVRSSTSPRPPGTTQCPCRSRRAGARCRPPGRRGGRRHPDEEPLVRLGPRQQDPLAVGGERGCAEAHPRPCPGSSGRGPAPAPRPGWPGSRATSVLPAPLGRTAAIRWPSGDSVAAVPVATGPLKSPLPRASRSVANPSAATRSRSPSADHWRLSTGAGTGRERQRTSPVSVFMSTTRPSASTYVSSWTAAGRDSGRHAIAREATSSATVGAPASSVSGHDPQLVAGDVGDAESVVARPVDRGDPGGCANAPAPLAGGRHGEQVAAIAHADEQPVRRPGRVVVVAEAPPGAVVAQDPGALRGLGQDRPRGGQCAERRPRVLLADLHRVGDPLANVRTRRGQGDHGHRGCPQHSQTGAGAQAHRLRNEVALRERLPDHRPAAVLRLALAGRGNVAESRADALVVPALHRSASWGSSAPARRARAAGASSRSPGGSPGAPRSRRGCTRAGSAARPRLVARGRGCGGRRPPGPSRRARPDPARGRPHGARPPRRRLRGGPCVPGSNRSSGSRRSDAATARTGRRRSNRSRARTAAMNASWAMSSAAAPSWTTR